MKCVANRVNELGNLGYSECLLIAIKFSSLKLSTANENEAQFLKAQRRLSRAHMKGSWTKRWRNNISWLYWACHWACHCQLLMPIMRKIKTNQVSEMEEMQKNKNWSHQQDRRNAEKIDYLCTETLPVRERIHLLLKIFQNQIELYWTAKTPMGFSAMLGNLKKAWA